MFHARMRPTWVEVDLDRIEANVQRLCALTPGVRVMAVVKADGYGHGAVHVARTALESGATWLGVATVEEGVELRHAGIDAPTLIFGYVAPDQAELLIEHNLRPALFNMELAQALSRMGRPTSVHLKIDTGMTRVGLRAHEALAFAQAVRTLPNIIIEGIFTHLAVADEPGNDYTDQQLRTFGAVLDTLNAAGIAPEIRHACNSAGLMLHPEAHYDLVRAGIAIYGLPPDPAVEWPVELQPALTWRTRVGQIKAVEPGTAISYGCTYRTTGRERVATIPVGYADGYSRQLSNRGEVLIRGHRCPIVGRVCMDQTMVRIPEEIHGAVGDEVVLIGEQEGQRITASDLAQQIGTINYEVICAISKRVPRFYHRHGEWLP